MITESQRCSATLIVASQMESKTALICLGHRCKIKLIFTPALKCNCTILLTVSEPKLLKFGLHKDKDT